MREKELRLDSACLEEYRGRNGSGIGLHASNVSGRMVQNWVSRRARWTVRAGLQVLVPGLKEARGGGEGFGLI